MLLFRRGNTQLLLKNHLLHLNMFARYFSFIHLLTQVHSTSFLLFSYNQWLEQTYQVRELSLLKFHWDVLMQVFFIFPFAKVYLERGQILMCTLPSQEIQLLYDEFQFFSLLIVMFKTSLFRGISDLLLQEYMKYEAIIRSLHIILKERHHILEC